MKTAILAILLFCVMIFPHELGHFIAAKKMGVRVNEFAFGMGPKLWKKRKGETLYSIRLFPVGGFCAMEGEDGQEDDGPAAEEDPAYALPPARPEQMFNRKKPWQKILILAAGSVMNLLCAILIMSLVLGIAGFTTTTVGEVTADSAAFEAGFQVGDEIMEMNGKAIENWSDVAANLPQDGSSVSVRLQGEDGERVVDVTPKAETYTDAEGNSQQRYLLGITCKISHSPVKAVIGGVESTWNIIKLMFDSLGMLFTGEAGADELTGPVGMVQMVSQTEELGFAYYGFLTALICVNLAIINMLPLPALDGGRIIFVLFSLITGKKVSEKVEGVVHLVGLGLLLCLMIYVSFHDVVRIFFSGK